jgi:DNA repair protein RecN (Recombination protein N)
LEEVIAWRTAAEELVAAPEGDELVAQLRARIDELTTRLNQLSTKISQQRTKTAGQLSEAVTHELRALAMSSSSLTVDVSATTHGPAGSDDVAFLLQPRADATPVPLHKGASGGELSRVMLALEVVLAGADPVGTFVFDEVDAGVGGRAAVDVGLRLSRLGQQAQVVIVTHLPQVAAFADQHFVVVRDDNESRATIVELDSSQRAGELTRMLAGLADSQAGLAHAEELLMTAGQMKAQDRA